MTMIQTSQARARDERSILRRVGDWLSGELEAIRRRRALYALLDMDQHMLDDIGVTRGDLDWALHLPLRVNAAVELRKVARGRRETVAWRRRH